MYSISETNFKNIFRLIRYYATPNDRFLYAGVYYIRSQELRYQKKKVLTWENSQNYEIKIIVFAEEKRCSWLFCSSRLMNMIVTQVNNHFIGDDSGTWTRPRSNHPATLLTFEFPNKWNKEHKNQEQQEENRQLFKCNVVHIHLTFCLLRAM